MRAKNGPSGKAATNSVTKPYWITGKNKNKKNKKQKNKTEFITSKSQPSPSLNRTSCAVLTHLKVFIKQPVHGILSQVIVQFPTCVFGQVGGFNILTASPPVLKLSVENNYNKKKRKHDIFIREDNMLLFTRGNNTDTMIILLQGRLKLRNFSSRVEKYFSRSFRSLVKYFPTLEQN